MAPQLAPRMPLPDDKGEGLNVHLADLFEVCFPDRVGQRLQEMWHERPVMGLHARIAEGEITRGQWLLMTEETFFGYGVNNGGLDGAIGNFPGLVADIPILAAELGLGKLAEAYERAAGSYLAAIRAARLRGEERWENEKLDRFWGEFEAADEGYDETAAAVIHGWTWAYPPRVAGAPENDVDRMQRLVRDYVLSHPDEFMEA